MLHVSSGLYWALICRLAVSTGHALLQRQYNRGNAALLPRGGARHVKLRQEATDALALWVDERPDITLQELCTRLAVDFAINVSKQAVSRALTTKIGYTMKLLRMVPESRNCPTTIQARKIYAQRFLSDAPPDRRNIVWVDECGFNLHLRRRCGRAKRGARASTVVATSRGANISVCAAMSEEGFLHEQLRPGPYNAPAFCDFLRDLFRKLEAMGRSACWIVLDNVRFHHCDIVATCVSEHGHFLMFLPPYSPMLNPIESLFGKWKTLIRTQSATFTRDELLTRMAIARASISVSDCLGWIRDMSRNLSLSIVEHIFE